ncbi:DUF3427 domain-containing protein [Agromyces binzhouensis]|uniref:DUF3427 domain-containing protein n=1 Tax=Agromyces binzhouensis TaxID=1817495 RepID=A0A4V1QTE8_9MICO|nr:DEAD/DEAH box helicase [Agromyces binzhouensis]RXZ51643.1 DUF3427 domain-containing protein [Agromyces binzhouensis]
MSSISGQIRRDNAFGFDSSALDAEQRYHPLLVSNQGTNTMLRSIRDELRRSKSFTFSVAFVTPSAIAMLKQALLDFEGEGTIVTSTYLGFNSPAAFRELLNLARVEVYIHQAAKGAFHAKGYVFEQDESMTAIIGSSNLTETALLTNHEWNLRFSALPDGDIVHQIRGALTAQLAECTPLSPGWVDSYEASYVPPPRHTPLTPEDDDPIPQGAVVPNAMQNEALAEIQRVRDAGEERAVVISATGTGKTILSALDVRSVDPARVLFIAHREQILDRAIDEFRRVLDAPRDDFGKFVGSSREVDRRYVFATVQSLSRPENLRLIRPDAFDYVLIDEVHRAGAGTYRRMIDYLQPKFILGVTATPERTDDFNIFELFDFNVPYEIRLQKALEEDMLAPFHYYGVTDFQTAEGDIIDDTSNLSQLVAPERADHIVRAVATYGHAGASVRGLIFCSRKHEAIELSNLLNDRQVHGRRLRTVALTGDDSIGTRESAVEKLERGELDYILTVDVFNEGIDIPTVNQVVMLRQTQSSIIFTQQLGRGLRKAAGKDHLVVIDFIGNYANNYLIPIALFGDNSLNKDSIRKRLIDAQEAGAISGLSSVNFDAISRDRIFESLANTSLDSMQNLKRTLVELENRLGHSPRLMDFARFDAADPTVVAGKRGSYWSLLVALKRVDSAPTEAQEAVLTFLSAELLNGKRPHELLLLQSLLADEGSVTQDDYVRLLERERCNSESSTVRSVSRVLSLEFFTEAERRKYGGRPLVTLVDGMFNLDPRLRELMRSSQTFAAHIWDVIETGLYLARHHYRWFGTLEVGQRYSRKDACRLLNWESNEQSTIYGYKVDYTSSTCPIFITYHKADSVSESTRYEDEFISESAITWFTRSRRTLRSNEVRAIVENRVPLHLFAKKDDAEGSDFYYLGRAHSAEARQEQMPVGQRAQLDVVRMRLNMDSPIETSLYEYLVTRSSPDAPRS